MEENAAEEKIAKELKLNSHKYRANDQDREKTNSPRKKSKKQSQRTFLLVAESIFPNDRPIYIVFFGLASKKID